MKTLKDLLAYLRDVSSKHGYTCDSCGKEVFDYPNHRLCPACEDSLLFNDGNTCEKCGRKTPVVGLCLDCKSYAPKYEKGVSPLVYKGGTPLLINRFKNGNQRLGYYLGELTAQAVLRKIPKTETLYVLPVPISRTRLQERGYNQAQVLAQTIGDILQRNGYDIAFAFDIMVAGERAPQKDLSYAQRRKLAKATYQVQKRSECKGKTFLIVDDILTSGATVNACAEKLLLCGAKTVYLAVASALC